MSKQTKTVDLECTSAFMAGGKMITPKQVVRGVPLADAQSLVRRGKAKIVSGESASQEDDKALADMNVAELKEIAKGYEIEGADGMKKAELIAAIEKIEDEGSE